MSTSAELHGHLGHIDLRHPTAGDEIDPILHPDQGEECIKILHVLELMDQHRHIADITVGRAGGHHHLHPPDMVSLSRANEIIEQEDLFSSQLSGDQCAVQKK